MLTAAGSLIESIKNILTFSRMSECCFAVMKNKASIIIPVYNEEKTLKGVLDAVTKSQRAAEIIVINDGSTDGSKKIIESFLNKIKIINFSNNCGKANALIAGVKRAKGNTIFLLDSDIENLTPQAVDETIKIFFESACDCLLGQFTSADKIKVFKIFDQFPFLIGNRIMKKQDFLKCLKDLPLERSGMGIETAVTIWLKKNGKKILKIKVPGVVHPRIKLMKRGIIRGIYQDAIQYGQIAFTFIAAYLRFFIKI